MGRCGSVPIARNAERVAVGRPGNTGLLSHAPPEVCIGQPRIGVNAPVYRVDRPGG